MLRTFKVIQMRVKHFEKCFIDSVMKINISFGNPDSDISLISIMMEPECLRQFKISFFPFIFAEKGLQVWQYVCFHFDHGLYGYVRKLLFYLILAWNLANLATYLLECVSVFTLLEIKCTRKVIFFHFFHRWVVR